MKCTVCPPEADGETRPGYATVTLTRGSMTLVFRSVPARVCENCGEEYVDEDATARLMQAAEEAARAGVLVDVREYALA